MGYKINPVIFRIGQTRTWNSFWYGDYEYSDLIAQDFQTREYLKDISDRFQISIGNPYIFKWLNNTVRITYSYYASQNNKNSAHKEYLKNAGSVLNNTRFVLANKVSSIKQQELFYATSAITGAQVIANYVSFELEKRNPFKEIMQDIMEWARITEEVAGIHISCSGRFQGEDRARTLWKKEGKMPYSTLNAHIDYGISTAINIYGSVGIKVWIYFKNHESISKKN